MRPPRKRVRRPDARGSLLASARELIFTRGYTNTSIDAINARAGLSKGTFYHYFASKMALLDAVVEQITDEGWHDTRRAMQDRSGTAIERFGRFLAAARRWRLVALPEVAEIVRAVFRPENALLRERVRERSIALAQPALADLLAEGDREGTLDVADPAAAARVFLVLAYEVSDDMMREVIASDLDAEALLARLVARGRAFMRATEAFVGVPRGALGGPEVELLANMVRAFRDDER